MTLVRTTKWLGIIFFLIPMCLISVFPLIVMISTSFKTQPGNLLSAAHLFATQSHHPKLY